MVRASRNMCQQLFNKMQQYTVYIRKLLYMIWVSLYLQYPVSSHAHDR